MATEGSDQAEGQHSEEGSLPNVVDRRTVLKGAAAVGLFAVGIPAVAKRPTLASAPSAPSAASARDSGVKLWDGQQVLTPYGLSFQGTPKRGGYLKWAWLYEPVPQLDPQLPTSGSVGDIDAFLWIYDQLTNYLPGTLDNTPGLAESWEIAKGDLEYTFTLRDAAFSNGDRVTADDVAFSLQRFANPKINGQYSFLNRIDTVEALNSKTVRVTLSSPQAMFIQVVGHGVSSIVPKRIFEADPVKFQTNPIGSGPFIFEAKVPGQSVTYKRNPNYWKSPKPWVDGFSTNYVPDDNARMLQVTSGIADIGYSVPYALVDQYKNFKGTRLQMEPYTNVIYAAPNISIPPLNETNVRLALNYANSTRSHQPGRLQGSPGACQQHHRPAPVLGPTHPLHPLRRRQSKVLHGQVVRARRIHHEPFDRGHRYRLDRGCDDPAECLE